MKSQMFSSMPATDVAAARSFWTKQLAICPQGCEVPAVLGVSVDASAIMGRETIDLPLPQDLEAPLQALCKDSLPLLHATVTAAVKICLRIYTGDELVAVGVPPVAESEASLANVLPLPTHVRGTESFRTLLITLRGALREAYTFQFFPYHAMAEALGRSDLRGTAADFGVVVAAAGLHGSLPEPRGRIVITLRVVNDTTRLMLDFDRAFYDRSAIEAFFGHINAALRNGLANLDGLIASHAILAPEEERLLTKWSKPQTTTPAEPRLYQNVVSAFESQVQATPEALCVVGDEGTLSYAALNERANQLARYLRSKGVGSDQLVGLCLDRSHAMVVGIYGIVKAGAAYVPLDPELPTERLRFMVEDAGRPIVLTLARFIPMLKTLGCRLVALDDEWGEIACENGDNLGVVPHSSGLAYMIFTSGSTGRPKGAMNTHEALMNRLYWMQEAYTLTALDRVLQKTPYSFDVSVWEFFWPCLYGAVLVMARPGGHREPLYLAETIRKHGVTTLHFVPSMLRVFLEEPAAASLPSLRRVICSGEALPHDVVLRFHATLQAELYNLYGPTEAAIDVSHYPCLPNDTRISVPIGWPIANICLYIVDHDFKLAPLGCPGELCIGGIGLARGYYARPDLTADRFVPDPFTGVPGARLYRTGDLVRYSSDGAIEFLGRFDHQVKIRGLRIELGEIESVLLAHPAVKDAAVLAREDFGFKQLVAYVVLREFEALSSNTGIDRVDAWRSLYDDLYGQSQAVDSALDLATWDSSYTGCPIPESEMRDWIDETVTRILAFQPGRVLEVGCGTGLLLFRIAPQCVAYHGFDLSAVAIDRVRAGVRDRGLDDRVTLECRAAHDLEMMVPESYDTIILNSVVQYFPSASYFLEVLAQCFRLLAPGGRIFVGDVRNYELRRPFYTYARAMRSASNVSVSELRRLVDLDETTEKELLISPALFSALPKHFLEISSVSVLVKSTPNDNEMSHFRYDAILHKAPINTVLEQARVLNWSADEHDILGRIGHILQSDKPDALSVVQIPNARLQRALACRNLLDGPSAPATAGDLLGSVNAALSRDACEPNDFWTLGKALGYEVEVSWSEPYGDGAITAWFRVPNCRPVLGKLLDVTDGREFDAGLPLWTNMPVNRKMRSLPELLQRELATKLPDYMVPSIFVIIEAMPLSPNGKIDRRALPPPPAPDESNTIVEEPKSPLETAISGIWRELLGLKQLATNADLFQLGCDSIVSMQAVSRLAQAGIRLQLKEIMDHPTVAAQAALAAQKLERPVRKVSATLKDAPLAPLQHWFWSRDLKEKNHWNLSLTLVLRNGMDLSLLAEAVRSAVAQHEAFRLRFYRAGDTIRQRLDHSANIVAIEHIDHIALDDSSGALARRQVRERVARSLDVEKGPIIAAVIFDRGTELSGRLFMTMHHLVSDAVSLRILVEDIQRVYDQLVRRSPLDAPDDQTTFLNWIDGLATFYARPDEGEVAYWRRILSLHAQAPQQAAMIANSEADAATEILALSSDETAVLQRLAALQRGHLGDIILAAYACVSARHSDKQYLFIDMEGHGRDSIEGEDELSRTVGWFSSLYPIVLNIAGTPTLATMLLRVIETLRAVPRAGIGFSALKAFGPEPLGRELSALPASPMCFNYLGNFDQTKRANSLFELARDEVDPLVHLGGERSHGLDLSGEVLGGRLHVSLKYGTRLYTKSEVAQMLSDIRSELVAYAASAGRHMDEEWRLTPIQEGMLFQTALAPNSGVYVMQMACRLKGKLDRIAFERAWADVVDTHAILRASFPNDKTGKARAIVRVGVRMPLVDLDWQGFDQTAIEGKLGALLEEDRRRGFDLSEAPLMRGFLAKVENESHVFVWTHHHLILDGWSIAIVLKDFFTAYADACSGSRVTLQARSFSTYLSWLAGQRVEASRAYWQETLADLSAPTAFGIDTAPSSGFSESAGLQAKVAFEFAGSERDAIQELARRSRVTLNTVFQAAWAILLARYCGQGDVCFGTVVSTRPEELFSGDPFAGPLLNTVPLCLKIDSTSTIADCLRTTQMRVTDLLPHVHCSQVDIQGWSRVPRGSRLFESIVAFENYPVSDALAGSLGGLDVQDIRWEESTDFPLSVVIVPGRTITVTIQYQRHRYSTAAIERLMAGYQKLLVLMAAAPEGLLRDLAFSDNAEHQWQLSSFNATNVGFPCERTVHALFQDCVAATPNALAVIAGSLTLSYSELNAAANRLARYLQAQGIGRDSLVGLCLPRGIEMIIALLATLKAGGGYVPLDPAQPIERLRLLLEDTKVQVVVTLARFSQAISSPVKSVLLDGSEFWGKLDSSNLPEAAHPLSLAYVLFTSGSTGRPKGVMIHHRAFINYLHWCVKAYGLKEGNGAPLISSLSYDLPLTSLFGPLVAGRTLHILPEEQSLDELISAVRRGADYSLVKLTPGHLDILSRSLDGSDAANGARTFVIGGEQLLGETLEWFRENMMRTCFVNEYGPTETVVGCSTHVVGDTSPRIGAIPIGKPIANTQLYVLDEDLRVIPLGAVGELYIGGEGVCRGYLGQPDLTADRFVPDRFGSVPGARLYRTGDLVRFSERGELEFIGRKDFQIKVRGFRVELGEVEAALCQSSGVRGAAVLARTSQAGLVELIAYIACDPLGTLNAAGLRDELMHRVPLHMIPSAFCLMDELPLNANGKVDRKALAEMVVASDQGSYKPARTHTEHRLVAIWAATLGLERIGIEDDFFAIGGHSLLASQVRASVHAEFGIELPLKVVFEERTIASLAAAVEAAEAEEAALLERLESMSEEEALELLAKRNH